MNREDIIKKLQEQDSTVMSFPDRGNMWGDSRWRGNTSGYIHAFLMWKYKTKKLFEVFAGSGTGSDVCKDMGVDYFGVDLFPTRDNIIALDAFKDDVPEEIYGSDMIFMHPPYSRLINVTYAGSMYPDPTGELSEADLGQLPWDEFMYRLNTIVMKYYSAMDSGAYMSMLMGDIRRNKRFYSMILDLVKPGEVQQVIIKKQNNCCSDNRIYSNKNFVPIVHEYILVLRKIIKSYFLNYQLPVKRQLDIRDSVSATWADVLKTVLSKFGRAVSVSEIYPEIEGCKKAQNNRFWKEKVRQTLQINKCFVSDGRDSWRLAAN